MASTEARSQLEYKGFPLRRKDNLIYYGSMADKYIIMMQIVERRSRTSMWPRRSSCSCS